MAEEKTLTPRQSLFCALYVLSGDNPRAAYAAAYTNTKPEDAEGRGTRLLRRPGVSDEVERFRALRVGPVPGDAAGRDEAALECAATLAADASLSARERSEALKTYAALRKVITGAASDTAGLGLDDEVGEAIG